MTDILCKVARLKSSLKIPALQNSDGLSLSRAFYINSYTQIRLQFEEQADALSSESMIANDVSLEIQSQKLLGPPVPDSSGLGVDHICLIVADSYYDSPTAFGVMFNYGFKPDFTDRQRVPRRGAAIFVNAIKALRKASTDYQNECFYTAAHELGHLFNLPHGGNGFMQTSPVDAPFDTGAHKFDAGEGERVWLSDCPTSPKVHPGGSDFLFNSLRDRVNRPNTNSKKTGEVSPYSHKLGLPRTARASSKFSLHIQSHPAVFRPFDPVELDITLKTISKKPVKIVDELHPGYARFALFITAPDGTRARYLPVMYHCPHGRVARVSAAKPHTVDLTLFGQAGGYTFSQFGVHELQAMYRLSQSEVLVSDPISVEVLPPAGKITAADRILSDSAVSRFLFYRAPQMFTQANRILTPYLRRNPKFRSVGALHYALARSLAKAAENKPRSKRLPMEKQARIHLEKAARDKSLTGLRSEKIQHYLSASSQSPPHNPR